MAAVEQGRDGVAEALAGIALEIAEARGRSGSLVERWARASVDVRPLPMRGRGRCTVSDGGNPVVMVDEDDNRYSQHFTVVHEIAHHLLGAVPHDEMLSIDYHEEEEICDDFAQRVLVPPHELASLLPPGRPPDPAEVLRLCGRFEVNPSTMLRALPAMQGRAYLLARFRSHFRRPAVSGFRIDAATGPRQLFWPYDARLATVGLVELARAAERAPHGVFFSGADERIEIPLARADARTGHNSMTGPVRWQAARQGRDVPYILALLDCSQLRRERVSRAARQNPTERHGRRLPARP